MFKTRIVDGVCANGCVPVTDDEKREQKLTVGSAVPIDYLWDNPDEQPIIADDKAFDDWLSERILFFNSLKKRGSCFFPWIINEHLPGKWRRNDKVVWNQGAVPSCGSTATSHAMEFYTLTSIAEGNTVEYTAFNPIYLHYGATNGNINVGISLFQAGKFINENGAFSIEDVGTENKKSPDNFKEKLPKAKFFRSAVCYLSRNNPDRWFRIAKACLPIVFGSSQYYSRSVKDKNGYSVGSSITSGGHAECVAGYDTDTEEYLYIQNSHGDIYGTDKTGKPQSGYWVTKRECEMLCSGCENYGNPFVPIPHCLAQDDATLNYGMNLRRK